MRILKAALAASLALALSIPAYSHHVEVTPAGSDVEAFAVYLSEWRQDRDAIIDLFFKYRYAPTTSEKSTAGLHAQQALVVTEEHLASLDVRECFASYHELATEFVGALLRYFEVVGPNPALAEALFTYAGSVFGALTPLLEGTLSDCAGTTDRPTLADLDEALS